MRVFRVVTEEDGKTITAPGISETERKRAEYRYAAENISEVWEAIAFLREDQERDIIAIHEEHPGITVLPPSAASHADKESK